MTGGKLLGGDLWNPKKELQTQRSKKVNGKVKWQRTNHMRQL